MTRRTFLAWIAVLAPANHALALSRPPTPTPRSNPTPTPPPLDPAMLRALGDAVLPTTLGADGMRRAVESFQAWVDGYRPGAEVNHGYGTGTIARTPADPRPRWTEQLAALDTEARRGNQRNFADLPLADRQTLVRTAIEASARRPSTGGRTPSANDIASGAQPQTAESLPDPTRAPHVAIALLAHFYESSEANDLCYEAEIGKNRCRPLAAQVLRPVALARRRA